MAGPVWGTAEIRITADGTILPTQIRALSEKAGDNAGVSFSKAFNSSLNRNRGTITSNWRNLLRNMGNLTNALLPRRVGDALRSISTGIRNAARDAKANAPSFKEFWSQVTPSKEDWRQTFPGLTRVIQRTGTAIKSTNERVKEWLPNWSRLRVASRGIGSSLSNLFSIFRTGNGDVDRARKSFDRLGGSWKSLPHGFRQGVFWVGLFVASLAQLSGLGSAVAGTIIALGTAFVGLAAGIGLAVVGFQGLFKEGAKLNEGAQASLEAFRALGKQFSDLQSIITNAMFDNMAESIGNVGKAVTALTPAIEGFASIVGDNIAKVFNALSSDSGVANFQALIEGFGPIFSALTDAVIGFGTAIANIMIAALPTALSFSQAIADVGAAFATWTASEEGRARLAEFFSTAERIMPLVVDLFVAAGQALAGIVTPTTLNGLEQFLVSLTNAMPAVEGLLRVAGNLNIFGILAASLDAVGAALNPLIPVFETLASVLGEQILNILAALTPLFQALGLAIAPLVSALTPVISILGQLIASILPPLIAALMPVLQIISQLAPILIASLMPAFIAVSNVITQLVTALAPLLELLGPLIQAVITPLIPLVMQIADVFVQVAEAIMPIVTALLPPLEELIKAVTEVIAALMPVVVALIEPFLDLIPPLLQLIQPLLPPLVSLLTLVAKTISSLLVPIINALTPIISLLAQVIASVLVVALKVLTPIIEGVATVFTWLLNNVITPLANFITGVLVGAINGISKALQTVIGWIKDAINWFGNLFGAADQAGSRGRSATNGFASGGILVGPRRILAGEAGPEAIVPLNRALSQVDPSVRWLSAIAQNKSAPAMASGGMVGGGRIVNVEAGAFQINESGNPQRTALTVMNRLAERVAG